MQSRVLSDLIANFTARFSVQPTVICHAPGRIEVIGNHTDYNEGYVLSSAIDKGTYFLATPSLVENRSIIVSHKYAQEVEWDVSSSSSRDLQPTPNIPHWSNYLKGVLFHLLEMKERKMSKSNGFCAVFGGDLPLGAGLSSSASLEISAALAIAKLYSIDLSNLELAKLSQSAEHTWVGVKCGLLDQFSCIYGKVAHLVMSDFRTLEVENVQLGEDACFLIVNTHVHHNLVQSEYNERRESCEKAAQFFATKELGHPVTHLRDVSWTEWEKYAAEIPNQKTAKRAAHVIGENERVLKAKKLLEGKDHAKSLVEFGNLMYDSHLSSQNFFENSCKELNDVVDFARTLNQVLGARLSGGGFGGSVILLVHRSNVDIVKTKFEQAFKEPGYEVTLALPSGGARYL